MSLFKCPRCSTIVEAAPGRQLICPTCGFGAAAQPPVPSPPPTPTVAAPAANPAPEAKLSTGANVLVFLLVLGGLVPAAYVGNVAAKGLAEAIQSGGIWVAILVVFLTGTLLGLVAAAALGVAAKWPRGLAVIGGAGLVALAGLSVWMLIFLEDAREGVFVFGITVVALVLIGVFIKLFSR